MGDPYFPLDGNGGYDVKHYDLELTYDPETDELTGDATIEARATQHLSGFNLDFVGMTVDSVEVDDRTADWERDDQELTITPSNGHPEQGQVHGGDRVPRRPRDAQRNSASLGLHSTPTTAR